MKANPRHKSKLESLPSDQRRQLDAWLREGLTYKEVAGRLVSQFNIRAASSSLSAYYTRHVAQTSAGESAVRDLRIGDDLIEFEIVSRVRIRRADLAALASGEREGK